MNATTPTHPAESPEFLSRLQDGELSPPEAASFEEHRRTCVRCREAADSYTRALSIFRSASPRPAASDLSARILRKVRAQAPSRRPFGVTFGIDVRWAGVCAAALVVVIMAASILDEGPAPSIVLPPPASEPANVRARLLEKEGGHAEGERTDARNEIARGAARSDVARQTARNGVAAFAAEPGNPSPAKTAPSASGEVARRRDELAAGAPARAPQASPPATSARQAAAETSAPETVVVQGEAPLVDAPTPDRHVLDGVNAVPPPAASDKDAVAARLAQDAARARAAPAREEQKKTAALGAPSSRARASADAPGGEAGSGAPAAESVHLTIETADSFGEAPALRAGADDAALAPLRGREFVVIVESGGRVRSAAVWGESGTLRDLRGKAKDERESLSPLLELRFAPGERPRRLRLRIE